MLKRFRGAMHGTLVSVGEGCAPVQRRRRPPTSRVVGRVRGKSAAVLATFVANRGRATAPPPRSTTRAARLEQHKSTLRERLRAVNPKMRCGTCPGADASHTPCIVGRNPIGRALFARAHLGAE